MEAINIHKDGPDHSGGKALRYLAFMILLFSLAIWASWAASQPRDPYKLFWHPQSPPEKMVLSSVILGPLPSVHVQNVGDSEAIITQYIVKDSRADTVGIGSVTATDGTLAGGGGEADIPFSLSGTSTGQAYTITLVTQAGGAFVSPTFTTP